MNINIFSGMNRYSQLTNNQMAVKKPFEQKLENNQNNRADDAQKVSLSENYNAVYERNKSRIAADFGGYNNQGQRLVKDNQPEKVNNEDGKVVAKQTSDIAKAGQKSVVSQSSNVGQSSIAGQGSIEGQSSVAGKNTIADVLKASNKDAAKDADRNIMKGVSNILNEDEKTTLNRMKAEGLDREDMVYPERAQKLGNDDNTKAKLSEFASTQRNSLLEKSGMNDDELNKFLDEARKTYSNIVEFR